MISRQSLRLRWRTLAIGGAVLLGLASLPYVIAPISPVAVKQVQAGRAASTAEATYQEIPLGLPYLEGLDVRPDGAVVFGAETGELMELPAGGSEEGQACQIAALDGHGIGLACEAVSGACWSATFPVGLQRITPDGRVETITPSSGQPVSFTDDVALGPDGLVYVTEASTKFTPVTTAPGAPYVLWDFMEGRAHGRLLAYDPATDQMSVVLEGLAFPSGVTVAPDGTSLLIVEVTRYRVVRYGLTGAGKGKLSIFADGLPGIPDDVFIGPDGHVWVSLVAPRSDALENVIGRHPYLARLISILPWSVQNAMLAPAETGGSLLRLDADGRPACELRLDEGYPPANAVAWNGRILAGRLGGHELIDIDPSGCRAGE
jgi:sugar lactone lactonase YvrE